MRVSEQFDEKDKTKVKKYMKKYQKHAFSKDVV
jgi:hypothetical protein